MVSFTSKLGFLPKRKSGLIISLLISLVLFPVVVLSLSDPTRPLQEKKFVEKIVPPKLKNVIIIGSDNHNVAYIDGKRYQEKDNIAGFNIQKIKLDQIILEKNGELFFIKIIKQKNKQKIVTV